MGTAEKNQSCFLTNRGIYQIKSDEDMQEALREFNEAVRKKQKDK